MHSGAGLAWEREPSPKNYPEVLVGNHHGWSDAGVVVGAAELSAGDNCPVGCPKRV